MGLDALLASLASLATAEDPQAALTAVREQIATLSAADLGRVDAALVTAFDALYGDDDAVRTPEQVELLAGIGEVTTAVRERAGEFTAAADRAASLRTAMHPPAPVVEPEPVAPTAPAAEPAAAAVAAEPEPAAALAITAPPVQATSVATPGANVVVNQGPSLAAMNAARPAALASRPTDAPAGPRVQVGLFTSTGAPGLARGDAIPSRAALGNLIHSRLKRFGQGAFEQQHLAQWRAEYPEDRQLSRDPNISEERINAVTSLSAITASGGVCNPVNVDYSVPTWGDDSRPLRDSLPSFSADRGGLRFVAPPKITDTVATASTAVWTEATDANPSSSTKALGTIVCGTEMEVYVDAIPTRTKVGNMQSRYSPEQVAASTDVVMTYAARVTELNLLAKITAASTTVAANRLLGAHRDVLAALDLALAAFRYRHRLPQNQWFRMLMPYWGQDMMRADILREQAHDDAGTDIRAVPDAVIEGWFTKRNCNVTWLQDSEPVDGTTAWTGFTPVSQQFGTQSAAYLLNWPTELHFWLFPEGSFLHLDGGTLNLGIVRDSVLDGTNDYETFTEIFESIAFRGVESYRVVATVLPTGQSALPIAVSAAPPILVGGSTTGHGNGGSF